VTFVFQHLCSSIHVPAFVSFVFQRLCSLCVLHNQPISINDNLNHLRQSSVIAISPTPTHQLLVSTMYSTCTTTKIPHQFHHPNLVCSSVIDLVYMITFLQTFLNFLNKRLAFSSNFSLVSHA
jgi:hypothetical protein